jgi:hypothetical protein
MALLTRWPVDRPALCLSLKSAFRRRSMLRKDFDYGERGADEDQRADDRADSHDTNVAKSFHRCLVVFHTGRRASATKYFTTQLCEQNAAGIKGATSKDCCALP